ncbi:hypothetical protein BJ508DRAFT_381706 [Ascobolus immersus RN42]|uniref:Uncharacterized protein n=1 Tax=Ascobolus immersus RN42 TaxID=1160509 RepID=A0A3N4HIW8_ASCIM|nr:hypothetical protein BJ508DRAFT_381706 [Ascobolus immersus RN42]
MFNFTSSSKKSTDQQRDDASTLASSVAPSTSSSLHTLASKLTFWKSTSTVNASEMKETLKTAESGDKKEPAELTPEQIEKGKKLARKWNVEYARGPGTSNSIYGNPNVLPGAGGMGAAGGW